MRSDGRVETLARGLRDRLMTGSSIVGTGEQHASARPLDLLERRLGVETAADDDRRADENAISVPTIP